MFDPPERTLSFWQDLGQPLIAGRPVDRRALYVMTETVLSHCSVTVLAGTALLHK